VKKIFLAPVWELSALKMFEREEGAEGMAKRLPDASL
jgi:hypothetical protein